MAMHYFNTWLRFLVEGEFDVSSHSLLTVAACVALMGYGVTLFTGRGR
jgi:hypothetical protein